MLKIIHWASQLPACHVLFWSHLGHACSNNHEYIEPAQTITYITATTCHGQTTLNASSMMLLLVQFVGEVSNYKPTVTCVPKSLTCIMQVHCAHAHCQSVEVNTDMPTSTTKSPDGRNKNSTTIPKTCQLEALLATSNMARKKKNARASFRHGPPSLLDL